MTLRSLLVAIILTATSFLASNEPQLTPKEILHKINHGQKIYLKTGNAYFQNPTTSPKSLCIGYLRKVDDNRYMLTIFTDGGGKCCIDTIKSDQVIILDRQHVDPTNLQIND